MILLYLLFAILWWASGLLTIWAMAFVFEEKHLRPESLTINDILTASAISLFGPLVPLFCGIFLLSTWIEDKKILNKVVWRRD